MSDSVAEGSRAAPNGRMVPFVARATAKDIFYCFRLLLGRHPHPEEWRGHVMRTGDDLREVVASYSTSLECARRGLFSPGADGGATLSVIDGFQIYSSAGDALIGKAIRNGSYEPEVCAVFRQVLRPGMNVLDLGANIGFFTLLAAKLVGPAGHVTAVEPNPRNARLLEASRRINAFANVDVVQAAAASRLGLLTLNSSYSNGTTSALPEEADPLFSAETVMALPIDAVLSADRRVHLVKVDVEGAEYEALRGCEAMIRRDRPIIVTEFSPMLLPGISGIDGPAYLLWLIGLGCRLSIIRLDGTLDEAGRDARHVMRSFEARGSDHIDVLADFDQAV